MSPPPKLRASCDECGAAKVKCDREQPSCKRCSSMGIPCVYGICRKVGKPRRARQPLAGDANNASTNIDQVMTPVSDILTASSTIWNPDAMWDLRNSSSEDIDMSSAFDFNCSDVMNSSFFPGPGQALDSLSIPKIPQEPIGQHGCIRNLQNGSATCSQEALELLGNLQFDGSLTKPIWSASPMNTTTNMSHAPLERVLTFGRAAGKRLGPLLTCSCALSPHVFLLFGSILARILDCYQQAINSASCNLLTSNDSWKIDPPSSTPSLDGSISTDSRSKSVSSEQQQHSKSTMGHFTNEIPSSGPRISIGSFNVDDSQVQAQVQVQILSAEARRIGELIGQFNSLHTSLDIQGDHITSGRRHNLHQRVALWLRDTHSALTNATRYKLQELDMQ